MMSNTGEVFGFNTERKVVQVEKFEDARYKFEKYKFSVQADFIRVKIVRTQFFIIRDNGIIIR